ncbi:hypothetical protein CEE37_12990 [candidate division LCP-89 bacterium B3_LCP]|uniref:Uncharacterized protein n=1 Tax=candidate division LCP-89 bacterium B3_LCP TaxID=2012998 RepID=A0A532UU06_UNCL8|nr:MAG: hypothetical protein CEE37_12990 [candidate division LCP-89 bacterium B3_LCP]
MQVRDNNTQLLYGLFQSICGWALDTGYKDISGMKNLLKLAMVDTCHKRHEDKSTLAGQMAIVADLGISLRNVQYSLKALEEVQDLTSGFVKIREIQKEITIILLAEPQTEEQILHEISYLIHAPHDLQKRTLKTILRDMVKKDILRTSEENGATYFNASGPHISLFDTTDLSSRVSGLLTHINAYNNTIGRPLYKIFAVSHSQARGLHKAIHEFLLGTGNAYEHECSEANSVTKPYYFYIGSAPNKNPGTRPPISEAILEVIKARFNDPESTSMIRNHWYHLTPSAARCVYNEVRKFVEHEGILASQESDLREVHPFTFYFGLADRQRSDSIEENQS